MKICLHWICKVCIYICTYSLLVSNKIGRSTVSSVGSSWSISPYHSILARGGGGDSQPIQTSGESHIIIIMVVVVSHYYSAPFHGSRLIISSCAAVGSFTFDETAVETFHGSLSSPPSIHTSTTTCTIFLRCY